MLTTPPYADCRVRIPVSLALMVALLATVGCAISQAARLEADPELVELGNCSPVVLAGLATGSGAAASIAVAPVTLVTSLPPPVSEDAEAEESNDDAEEPVGWTREIPVDPRALQEQLARALSWSGMFGDKVTVIEAGQVREGVDTATRINELCAHAEATGSHFVLTVEVERNSVAYLHDRGMVWWLNLAWYTGVGPQFGGWWVGDEIWTAHLKLRATLFHARTRQSIFSAVVGDPVEGAIDDFQRGLIMLDSMRVPSGLGPEHWRNVSTVLGPHAEKSAVSALLRTLDRDFRQQLTTSFIQDLLVNGSEQYARTFALLMGVPGPANSGGAAPLRHATADAMALAKALVKHDPRTDVTTLTGNEVTHSRLEQWLERTSQLALGRDRILIYYAGPGAARAGDLFLLTDDAAPATPETGSLAVSDLARHCSSLRSRNVLFILDTSFAGSGGRTWPTAGTEAVSAVSYLRPLANADRGFRVLAAARHDEVAQEIDSPRPEEQHGVLTFAILGALMLTDSDLNGDGLLDVGEVFTRAREEVPGIAEIYTGYQQHPQLLGATALFPIARLRSLEQPAPEDAGAEAEQGASDDAGSATDEAARPDTEESGGGE